MLLTRFITLSPRIKKFLTVTAVLIGLSYPFLVYFGLSAFSPQVLIAIVLGLLGLRVWIIRKALPLKHQLIWPAIVAILGMGIAALAHVTVAVKLYPVVISVMLGAAFLWSLIKPPTAIELIARIREPDLDAKGVAYTRKVTMVWVGFFVMNAAIATWTVLFGTIAQWTLYNGLISYCLTGILFAGEFMVRRVVRAKG